MCSFSFTHTPSIRVSLKTIVLKALCTKSEQKHTLNNILRGINILFLKKYLRINILKEEVNLLVYIYTETDLGCITAAVSM